MRKSGLLADRCKPDLVCIVGLGHSGSTLLDMILGSHRDALSLGEIMYLDTWLLKGGVCTCCRDFSQCEFWVAILQENTAARSCKNRALGSLPATAIPLWRTGSALEQLRHGLAFRTLDRVPAQAARWLVRCCLPRVRHPLAATLALYDQVRKRAGRRLLVDSSKYARRAKLLYAASPQRTRIVHLTRDGRGWIASQMRRSGMTAETAVAQWLSGMERTKLVLASLPDRDRLHIRYENLCREPERVVKELCAFVGLEFEPGMLSFRGRPHHNIGGNPMRLESMGEVREDTRWRSWLPADAAHLFEKRCGALNRVLLGDAYAP